MMLNSNSSGLNAKPSRMTPDSWSSVIEEMPLDYVR